MALQSRTDDLTFDRFAGRLPQEAARRQEAHVRQPEQGHSNSSSAAFTAKYAMRGRSSGGRNGMRRGGTRMGSGFGTYRGERVGGEGGATGGPKPRGKSFYCQKEGHWKRDCYKREADEGKNIRSTIDRSETGLAFTANGNEWSETVLGTWIVDTGASQHLSGTRKIFIEGTYEAIAPKGIEIADRSKIQAVGRGDVKIGKLDLSNMLFVPQLGGNLLSVA